MNGVNEHVEPLFNDAFLRVFGSEESRGVTRSLVNSIFARAGIEPIGEIESIGADVTTMGTGVEMKSGRYDVHIVSEGRRVDLESERHEGSVQNRSLFYAARSLVDATTSGMSYADMPQSIVLTLYDAMDLFPEDDEFVSTCSLVWQVGQAQRAGTDRILFVLVELKKFRRRYNELTEEVLHDDMLSWLYLLTSGYDNVGEVEEMKGQLPSIEEFAKLYGFAVNDPDIVGKYRAYQTSIMEENRRLEYYEKLKREAVESGLQQGIEQGIAQGIELGIEQGIAQGVEQGIEQGERKTLVSLVNDGLLSAEEAANWLGVDVDELMAEPRSHRDATGT